MTAPNKSAADEPLPPRRYVTIKMAQACTGYSARAIETKIQRGVWVEGREFVYAPDGRRLVDLEGYERWAARKR